MVCGAFISARLLIGFSLPVWGKGRPKPTLKLCWIRHFFAIGISPGWNCRGQILVDDFMFLKSNAID